MPTSDERAWQARIGREAPRVAFDRFVRTLDWQRGEHFGLIGPTGQGKTNMLLNLLPLHPFVTVFATKPSDQTMDKLAASGYYKMTEWQGGLPATDAPRRILWPDARSLNSAARQTVVFRDALDKIYREGGWTIAFDELAFIANTLKLGSEVRTYYTQSRALDISVIAATQRPAHVPLEMYDQSTHLMFWRTTDKRALDRIQEINYGNTMILRRLISQLDRYQVLYIDVRTGRMVRTTAPLIT